MEMKPEQWKETEERVNEAEKAKRKAVKSSRELKKETGLIHKERDVLTHEENALLVPTADSCAIADAVERLIRDEALRSRLIENGYKMATSATFEIEGMAFLKEIKEVARNFLLV